MKKIFVAPSWIRHEIVQQILASFQATMPIYAQMIGVADAINAAAGDAEAKRLGKIMHAAIRCASADELKVIKDVFALMGCEPVNYYDLRERVSVESTAFRPTTVAALEEDGFRVFCSKLAMDCIAEEHRGFVESIIARREIFNAEILGLIKLGLAQGGFEQAEAEAFVRCCVSVFTRPDRALISLDEFEQLRGINKVACQILVSNALAFNHLTPSVASVPAAHEEMLRRGIQTIPVWQGPVGKDVILRQTSCLAPAITLKFPNGDGTFSEGDYQETFVEFEERLQALTPKGRELFEEIYDTGKQALELKEGDSGYAEHYYAIMQSALARFPSDLKELWDQQLAYFTFELSEEVPQKVPKIDTAGAKDRIAALLDAGVVQLVPQQYEDFFGPAATNIFNSNIGLVEVSRVGTAQADSQQSYEAALGRAVVNMYDFYDRLQENSLSRVLTEFGPARECLRTQ